MKAFITISAAVLIMSSCAIVRPGEVGVKTQFGKLSEPKTSGTISYNPLIAKVIKLPTKTVNREVSINLPSREGLTIKSEISIMYRIIPEKTKSILTEIGTDYDRIITAVFRSASADVTSKYYAKDMHSGKRGQIETEISDRMNELLNAKGFEVEAVLMKAISLPDGLANAIESKLKAEQEAQRMEFTKQQETLEAERKLIQAQGNKNAMIVDAEAHKEILRIKAEGTAQATLIEAQAQQEANEKLNKTITPSLIQLKQVEAFSDLSRSSNAKVIITDGKTPFLSLP
jgi:prohibitin 1